MFIASCKACGARRGLAAGSITGPGDPACEVEKNTGSISAKSCSACIRCISTEPTIPRQPTKPTFIKVL